LKALETEESCWTICLECKGLGKKRRKPGKKVKLRYRKSVDQFEKTKGEGSAPVQPLGPEFFCPNCNGSGLIPSDNYPVIDKVIYPQVAIIGGGIGGVALAVACLHRGIPFTLYERDNSFDARAQGYGLTLQQASKVIKGLGIVSLKQGIKSTRHVVYSTEGKVIVEWGLRLRKNTDAKTLAKRMNVHITRQALRLALIEQLGGSNLIKWGHQLVDIKKREDESVELHFEVSGKMKTDSADLLVGADGIRSVVRMLLIGEENNPLRYLGFIVILGICPIKNLNGFEHPLLDSATVFQTVNGNERIYVMPFSSDAVMWQLSFPMTEAEAKTLSAQGNHVLKEEACRRIQWHDPLPQILAATSEDQITGYPVYDRELLDSELLKKCGAITMLGDAAHPMSPFKGQGANQALLDALALARSISLACGPLSKWREAGIRKCVLSDFESEMLIRSASKVKDSAEAAMLLHSDIVLREGDGPKGRSLK
jgi:2-polyprenyl-6-methoxyphenol hydroxylase-like FAD-dependent oxidoreductase